MASTLWDFVEGEFGLKAQAFDVDAMEYDKRLPRGQSNDHEVLEIGSSDDDAEAEVKLISQKQAVVVVSDDDVPAADDDNELPEPEADDRVERTNAMPEFPTDPEHPDRKLHVNHPVLKLQVWLNAAQRGAEEVERAKHKVASPDNQQKRSDMPCHVKIWLLHVFFTKNGTEYSDARNTLRVHGLTKTKWRQQQLDNAIADWWQLLQRARIGTSTAKRVCDASKKHSKYKQKIDDVFDWVRQQIVLAKPLSRSIIRQKFHEEVKVDGVRKEKVFRRFLDRYGIHIGKAKRVSPDTPEVQCQKMDCYFWRTRELWRVFHEILSPGQFCNIDEVAMSPSGTMQREDETVMVTSVNGTLKEQGVAKKTIMSDKYKAATFLPFAQAQLPEHNGQPMVGFLLFRGNPRDFDKESLTYDKRVYVRFNASGSVDERFMLEEFLPVWRSHAPRDNHGMIRPRVLFMDHHKAHFTARVKAAFEDALTIVVAIPKLLTSLLQFLDRWFFFVRYCYRVLGHKYIADERNEPNPDAAGKRMLMTRWCSEAYLQVMKRWTGRGTIANQFRDLGMIDPVAATVEKLRGVRAYQAWSLHEDFELHTADKKKFPWVDEAKEWQNYLLGFKLRILNQQPAKPVSEPPQLAKKHTLTTGKKTPRGAGPLDLLFKAARQKKEAAAAAATAQPTEVVEVAPEEAAGDDESPPPRKPPSMYETLMAPKYDGTLCVDTNWAAELCDE